MIGNLSNRYQPKAFRGRECLTDSFRLAFGRASPSCYHSSRMSSKKKRNKQYKGSVPVRPTITKVSAVHRSPIHQWWIDHKRMAKPVGIAVAIAIAIIVIIIGIVGIIW